MKDNDWKMKMIPSSPGTNVEFKNFTIADGKNVFVGFDDMNYAVEVREGTFEENAVLYYEKEESDLTDYELCFMDISSKEIVKEQLQKKLVKLGFNKDQINDIYQEFTQAFYE